MQKSLAKNTIFNVLYKVLNVLFPLVSATYIARVLLPEGVGRVASAQNLVSYFTLLAALGIPSYGVREIAKRRDSKKETNSLFSELVIINVISTIICVVAYYILIGFFITDDWKLRAVCGLLIAFNFLNIDWLYQGKEEYAYIAIRSIIIKIISVFSLFVFVNKESDYIKYALITVLASAGNYAFNVIQAHKYVKFTLKNLNISRHFKSISYLIICIIATELYSKVDVTMLSTMTSNKIVGYYSNAHKLIHLVITMTTAISAVFLPRLSYYYENNKKEYNYYLSIGVKIVMFFIVPCLIGVFIVSDSMMKVLFGASFLPAAVTLRIFTPLLLLKGLGDILCYQVIISSCNEKKLIFSYMGAAVINIVLNTILIPTLSQNGAAIASVISEAFVNLSLLLYTRKLFNLEISSKYWSSLLLSATVLMLVASIVSNLINNTYMNLIITVAVGGVAYISTMVITKNEILDTLRRKLLK